VVDSRPVSRGIGARLLLPLGWCLALVVLLLATAAGTTPAGRSSDAASLPAAPASGPAVVVAADVVHDGRVVLDRSDEPARLRQDGDGRRTPTMPVALESETDDEDAQQDMSAATLAAGLVWIARVSQRAPLSADAVDTSDWLVSTGLARGPPVAS
jgi:hypothetical protein